MDILEIKTNNGGQSYYITGPNIESTRKGGAFWEAKRHLKSVFNHYLGNIETQPVFFYYATPDEMFHSLNNLFTRLNKTVRIIICH